MNLAKKLAFHLILGIICFCIGWLSYSNKQIRTALFVYKDFIESKVTKPTIVTTNDAFIDSIPSFELLCETMVLSELEFFRKRASYRNMLYQEEKKKYKAKLVYNTDTFNVKIRLKGGRADHYGGNKWSVRIKVLDTPAHLPIPSEFSLQDPATRNYVGEWLYHKYLNYLGLQTITYEFCNFSINGIPKGIYALEESFYPTMFQNAGPIYAFDEQNRIENNKSKYRAINACDYFLNSFVKVFNEKKTKALFSEEVLISGAKQLEKLRNNEVELEDVFNIDKFATLFATADLFLAYHVINWKNIRLYYNTDTQKFEPIPYDANAGGMFHYILLGEVSKSEYPFWFCKNWIDLFLKNDTFLTAYFEKLNAITTGSKNFKLFVSHNKTEINNWVNTFTKMGVYNENSNLVQMTFNNVDKLTNNIKHNVNIQASLLGDSLYIKNLSFLPITIKSINSIDLNQMIRSNYPNDVPSYTVIPAFEKRKDNKKLKLVVKTISNETLTVTINSDVL